MSNIKLNKDRVLTKEEIAREKLVPDLNKAHKQVQNKEDFRPDFTPENKRNIESEYKIAHKILGSGAFGEVRIATHLKTKQKRAVKIVFKQYCSQQE